MGAPTVRSNQHIPRVGRRCLKGTPGKEAFSLTLNTSNWLPDTLQEPRSMCEGVGDRSEARALPLRYTPSPSRKKNVPGPKKSPLSLSMWPGTSGHGRTPCVAGGGVWVCSPPKGWEP